MWSEALHICLKCRPLGPRPESLWGGPGFCIYSQVCVREVAEDCVWAAARVVYARPWVYGRQSSSEGGSLSPAGPSLPALGHPGWKHSLTWAGSARRRAGCQAQNLPGVSDGCSASFQRPLIIQRSSLSVHLFLLSLPIHSAPYITYSVHAYTQVHTHDTHPDAHMPP